MQTFKNGFLTGLILQLALGPVFFFVLNITLQQNALHGFAAVLGVACADYIYIVLAMLGVGELLQKEKIQKVFGIASALVLMVFGMYVILHIFRTPTVGEAVVHTTSLYTSFVAAFLFTIASPLTIVFFTSLFAAKVVEYKYTKRALFVFAIATGLATVCFMGSVVGIFTIIKFGIPKILIQILNLLVGCVLIGYGGVRFVKSIK